MRLVDIDKFVVDAPRSSSLEFDAGVLYVLNKLDAAPTVDAEIVIRCKDCIHSSDVLYRNYYCGYFECAVYPHFFCADGEKRKEDK